MFRRITPASARTPAGSVPSAAIAAAVSRTGVSGPRSSWARNARWRSLARFAASASARETSAWALAARSRSSTPSRSSRIRF